MKNSPALAPETRVLDVGAPDAGLARDLAGRGVTRYLALVEGSQLSDARHDAGPLAGRFHPLISLDAVFRCSTDLLVLRTSHHRLLWAARDLGHVKMVAVERGSGATRVDTMAAALAGRAANKLVPRGQLHLAGRVFDLFETVHRLGPAPRTYFSPVWGPAGLATRLQAAGLRYVVLRWFESLPEMEPGEDLDVLVADEDAAALRTLLEEEPGTIPVDLYSTSGLPHSDYQGAAYYPPNLARALLARAEQHPSGFLVPASLDHLHSLAYHAVYHKGTRSGIDSELLGRPVSNPEHDYRSVLTELAERQGITLPSTLEGLDEYLSSVGWQPPGDALRRLAPSNAWISAREDPPPAAAPDGSELAVFLVREETLTVLTLQEVLGVLDHFGFDVITTRDLDQQSRQRYAQVVRGGNWGPGPYARSGGEPAVVVVALHYAPDTIYPWLLKQYPRLTNLALYFVKQHLRALIESRVDHDARFNPIHSADNETEAWEYLAALDPSLTRAVADEVTTRRTELQSVGPVVRTLSRGRRARVDVVEGPDGPVVRKTFSPPFRRHMERELRAMRELAGAVSAVPPILETGPNWFTCPYYDNTLAGLGTTGRLVPLRTLREMVSVLRRFHELGFDLVDARPHNFLHDPRAGLKVVDFEFFHEYADGQRPPFARSYNFVSTPADFTGDIPVGDQAYDLRWLPFTGLPLDVLIDGSVASQRVHRALYRLRRLTVAPGSPLRHALGRARSSARSALRAGYARYAGWARQRADTTRSSGSVA